ncbi:MAG: hypothetical protein ACK4N5_03810 [Myxococcales bacterium]
MLTPESDLTHLAQLALDAVTTGNWWGLAAVALFGAVWALRRFGGAKWPVLTSPRAGAVMVLLLAVLGALATSLLAGQAPSALLLLAALKVALGAAGGREVLLKLMEPAPAAKAAAAGVAAGEAAAARASESAQAAADELGKLGR